MQTFFWPIRIYYEDTDHGGVVYYANYLKYLERARTEWLRSLGFELDVLSEKEQLLFAVRHLDIEYLQPARFNERLQVSVHLVHNGGASLELEQKVKNAQGTYLCVAEVKLACLHSQTLRPRRMPPLLQKMLATLNT